MYKKEEKNLVYQSKYSLKAPLILNNNLIPDTTVLRCENNVTKS